MYIWCTWISISIPWNDKSLLDNLIHSMVVFAYVPIIQIISSTSLNFCPSCYEEILIAKRFGSKWRCVYMCFSCCTHLICGIIIVPVWYTQQILDLLSRNEKQSFSHHLEIVMENSKVTSPQIHIENLLFYCLLLTPRWRDSQSAR